MVAKDCPPRFGGGKAKWYVSLEDPGLTVDVCWLTEGKESSPSPSRWGTKIRLEEMMRLSMALALKLRWNCVD